MKIARQRVSATKSGNGLQKTLQTISIWRWLLFILFFYFSVVLVVIREKSPQLWGFPRQPARQRDSNRGCNGLSLSEWKLHLFCDLHKTIHRFFRRVAGVRCRVFTLPALLPAIFGKHPWVRPFFSLAVPAKKVLVTFLSSSIFSFLRVQFTSQARARRPAIFSLMSGSASAMATSTAVKSLRSLGGMPISSTNAMTSR